MGAIARFIPEHCPGCKAPMDARYSQYSRARQHVLYLPLQIVGVVLIIVLSAYLFWSAAMDVLSLIDAWGLNLHRREKGLLFFFSLAVSVPLVLWVARKWWRFLDRLPRRFEYECPACPWKGSVKVHDISEPMAPTGEIRVQVEIDGIPSPSDLLEAQRERQWRREERERGRIRAEESESPPNQDFDFRDH